MTSVSVESRFWGKVDKTDTCWLWTAATQDNGYGSFFIGRVGGRVRLARAHRFAYELAAGPIPDGLVIDHLCRVRNCVNPDHLEAVSNKENLLRGEGLPAIAAAKTQCSRGGHPLSGPNLYVNPRGERECKSCRRDADLRQKARRRASITKAPA